MKKTTLSATSGYEPFIRAYLDFRMYADKHPDLADFYTRRYRAFCEMFGMDPSRDLVNGGNSRPSLDLTTSPGFESAASFYLSISTPFEGCLEAPARLSEIANPYQARFVELASEQAQLCVELLCQFTEAIYGPCNTSVDERRLAALGLDTSKAPDPIDYW